MKTKITITLGLILTLTSLSAFSQSYRNINQGSKKIERCSNARDVSICTAKILNRKLNQILNSLDPQEEALTCTVKFCTWVGAGASGDPDSVKYCNNRPHYSYRTATFEVFSEREARKAFLLSKIEVDTDGDASESIKSISCI